MSTKSRAGLLALLYRFLPVDEFLSGSPTGLLPRNLNLQLMLAQRGVPHFPQRIKHFQSPLRFRDFQVGLSSAESI
jgi:hypothetical protein